MTFNAWQLTGVKNMDKSEDYKVDPRSIHVDQRKQDSRRDASVSYTHLTLPTN